MGYGVSSFIIKWVNFLTLGVSFCVLGLGIWLASKHGDCDKFLTVPVFVLGVFMLIISLLGFVGAWKNLVWVLCIVSSITCYLVIMFFLLAGLALFTAFAFVVTNEGAGRAISGQGFKEYNLRDYSGYIRNLFNNPHNWRHLRDCLLNPDYCAEIGRDYDSTAELANAQLNSMQSGCCRPPAECKFPMINVTYYNLSSRYIHQPVAIPVLTSNTPTSSNTTGSNSTSSAPPPPLLLVTAQITAISDLTGAPSSQIRVSSVATVNASFNFDTEDLPTTVAYQSPYRKFDDSDCITYENDLNNMCFGCNSCKAGVAQFIKKDWRLVALINIAVFIFLVGIYTIGCCARRNASRAQYTKKLKRESETENISQSRPKRRPFASSGQLSPASHDEELGLEPQVRCWQTSAPGEPEDLVPVQSICPMRAPWSSSAPVHRSRKRPSTTKRHGKKKMSKLEGQTMVPAKRPRTGGKEQLEHPLVPFGAVRRIVTVLDYESSRSREEQLKEQLPPAVPTIGVAPTSDRHTANEGDCKTTPLDIQVGRELSTITDTRQRRKSPMDTVLQKLPPKEKHVQVLEHEKPTPAPAKGTWGPLGVYRRPKSSQAVRQNILFDKDRKRRHSNALFEVDNGPQNSEATQRQAAPCPDMRRGWRKSTDVDTLGQQQLLDEPAEPDEGEDRERSYKVEMPPYTDVIIELDDTPERSETVGDHLKELGGIRIHVRDSGRQIVSWGYEESEHSNQVQGELEEIEGLRIPVRECERKRVSRGDNVSEESVKEDLKTSEGLRIHITDSERIIASRGDSVPEDFVKTELKDSGELRIFVGSSKGQILSWGGDGSENSVQNELRNPEGLRVPATDSEGGILSRDEVVSEESGQARLKDPRGLRIHVRDSERKTVPWGDDVSGHSVQGELKESLGLCIHVKDSERRIAIRSNDVSEGSVHEYLKKPAGPHTERKNVSRVDNVKKESVQEELKELGEPQSHVRDTKKNNISWGDDVSQESVQGELKEPGLLPLKVREFERKLLSRGDDVSERSVQEMLKDTPEGHVSNTRKKRVSWGDDVSEKSPKGEVNEPELLSAHVQESERRTASKGDDVSEASVQDDLKDSGDLCLRVRDSKGKISSRDEVVSAGSIQKELKVPGGLHVNVGDAERTVSSDNVTSEDSKSLQAEVDELRGLRVQVRDSERIIVSSGDPEKYTNNTKEQNKGVDAPRECRENKRRLETVAELNEKQLLSLKKEEVTKTTRNVNYDFAVPKLSRAINPILGPVKQKILKSTDEESRRRGVSQYVFDPPKISPSKIEGDEEPTPKPEEERQATNALAESNSRPKVEYEPRLKLEEKPSSSSDNRNRPGSGDETQAKLERKPRTNSLQVLVTKFPQDAHSKGDAKLLADSLNEPRPKSEEPRTSSFKELQRKPVEEPRPKLEEKSPRVSSSKEPQRTSVKRSPRKLEENPPRSSVKETRRRSVEAPPLEHEGKPPRTKYVEEPRPKSIYEHRSSHVQEPRSPIVRESRPKYAEEALPGSVQEPSPKHEGKPPRTKYLEEPRPKSIYEQRSLLVQEPRPAEEPRPKSIYEQRSLLVQEPQSAEELRPKSIYEQQSLRVQEPWPSNDRKPHHKSDEENRTTSEDEPRPITERKPRTNCGKKSQPRPKLLREAQPKVVEETQTTTVKGPQTRSEAEPQPTLEKNPRTSSVRDSQPRPILAGKPHQMFIEEPRPARAKDNRPNSPEPVEPRPKSPGEPRSTFIREHRHQSVEKPRPTSVREHRPKSVQKPRPTIVRERQEEPRTKPINDETHYFDTFERGESSTRRKSRKRKEKPQKPD